MELVYPENSILNKSILDIIELQESEKYLLWTSVEHLSLSSLGLDEIAWEHLRKQYVLKEDPLYDILVLSIDYIHSFCDSDLLFNKILDSTFDKIKSLTSLDIAIENLSNISKNNFLSLPDNIMADLPITPNLCSLNVLKSLTAHRITKLSHLTALIAKLNHLNALSEYDIIKIYGMNYESINLIKNIWLAISSIKAFLLEINMVIPSSFECMIKGWVSKHTKKEWHSEIIMRRMGWKGEIETLEQIGQTYGLTRERIRQVENTMLNALRKKSVQNELKPIDMVIDSFLYDAKGILSIHELGVRLRAIFNWPHVPHEDGLRNLIEFLPSAKYCLEDGYIHYTEHICGGCVGIISFLENYFKSHEEILISDLLHLIENHCNTICNHLDAVSGARFFESFIHYLIDNKNLKSFLKIDGNKAVHIEKWNLLKGRLILATEQVLKKSKRAMHYTEIYEEIVKLRPEELDITERNVYAYLERLHPKVILWDTGTFIHIENVKFDFTLIREIENWLLERLNENIPFISSYGAYLNFKDKCIQGGITNELAIYSCLRISNDSKLAYPHAPYVFLNIGNVTMPPLSSIIEDFIYDKERTVSVDEINKFAIGKIYMKSYAVAQILERTPNVVRARHGYYIHTDWLRLDNKEIYELIRHTQSMLSKSGHVSVVKVYNERKINCKLMGIDAPELLYSIMRLFNTGELKLTGFPQITLSDAPTPDGLLKNIEQYIREKNTYCSLQELNYHFVEGLGYSEQRVNSIVYRDRIYRYLKRCVVHKDTIEWNDEKQKQLEQIAFIFYDTSLRSGSYYALIDMLIHEDNLPELGNGLHWTEDLLGDLLKDSGNFHVLGYARNAYVAANNTYKIETFEDLIYYILKDKFSGASNLLAFTEYLRNARVIVKNLKPSMLGQLAKVSIKDGEVVLTELL